MVSRGKMTLPKVGAKCIAQGKNHLRGWRHEFTLVAIGERSILGKLHLGDEMQFKFSEWVIYDANDESNRSESLVDALMGLDKHFDLGREDFCREIVKAGWAPVGERVDHRQVTNDWIDSGMANDVNGFLNEGYEIYRKPK